MKDNGIFGFPKTVTWRITSNCVNNCLYCYGPKGKPDLNSKTVRKIIELLALRGVENIILTGGEPLLRPDFADIIEQLSSRKIKIILDTSCFNFFKYNFLIDEKVSDLGIPFDTDSEKTDFRSKDNFRQRVEVLNYYQNHRGKKPTLRVGTVVCKTNLCQLDKLADFLQNYRIDTWKLYQFIPMGENGFNNSERLSIKDEDFLKISWQIKQKYGDQIDIVISPKASRNRAYFMLDPDGSLIIPENSEKVCYYKKIGSVFDQNIALKWGKETKDNNYLNNFNKTFKLDNLSLPIESIYSKILHKSLPYYEKSQSYQLPHIIWMIKNSLSLIKALNLHKEILLPTIILHDIGHYHFRRNPYFAETRVGHMKSGQIISKKILSSIGYGSAKSDLISKYIGQHDLWSLGEKKIYQADNILGVFNDLNFSSILEDSCFSENKKFLDFDNQEMLTFASGRTKIKKYKFFCPETKKLHKTELLNKEYQVLALG